MIISEIFKNNRIWVDEKLNLDEHYFENLSKGQNPELLYIGCSDSRVSAEEMMGLNPGDAFVHRNIANLVINTDLSALSVINYAIKFLKIKHIIICGHYGCGGVFAALQRDDLGILNPWLKEIRDIYRLHKQELSKISDTNMRYKKLVELNVREQCVNLLKMEPVQKAMRKKRLQIHGWVFEIESGHLIDLRLDLEKIIREVQDIYELD